MISCDTDVKHIASTATQKDLTELERYKRQRCLYHITTHYHHNLQNKKIKISDD